MIPTALVISKIDNQVCSRRQIFRNPIGATEIGYFVKAGADSNGADAGVMAALDIDLFVANEKRANKIDIVFARGLQNHAGRGLATFGRLIGNIRAEISCVDQIIAELPQDFGFDSAILIESKKSASNSALVGDHN